MFCPLEMGWGVGEIGGAGNWGSLDASPCSIEVCVSRESEFCCSEDVIRSNMRRKCFCINYDRWVDNYDK